jgi:hypothetical protein
MGGGKDAHRILVGKPEGKRPLVRPLDISKRIILRWILERWNGMDWNDLVQDMDQ